MKKKYIVTIILLAVIAVFSLVALFIFPYKVLFSLLLALSALGLFVCYLIKDSQTFGKTSKEEYIDVIITDELDKFFSEKKPYLNANYKISDLEKQLGVSREAISAFTKKRFGVNFNQFLDLWRILELRELRSKLENEDVSIGKLCVRAGFRDTQHYVRAERDRKARAVLKKMQRLKSKPAVKKHETDKVKDLNVTNKPDINMRV
jgi:AraC-like DNA-binding protein